MSIRMLTLPKMVMPTSTSHWKVWLGFTFWYYGCQRRSVVAWLCLAPTSNLGVSGSRLRRLRALSPVQEHPSGIWEDSEWLPGFVSLPGPDFSPRPVVVKLRTRSPLTGNGCSFHSDDVLLLFIPLSCHLPYPILILYSSALQCSDHRGLGLHPLGCCPFDGACSIHWGIFSSIQ